MMEVCINNNDPTNWSCQSSNVRRPKRDFRFQVIEVCQSPKYFVWPSRNRGSTDTIDENHNKETKSVQCDAAAFSSTSSVPQQYVYASTQNGYGAMRRSVLRSSKRALAPDALPSPRTASEPAANRRLSLKKEKAATEPLSVSGSPSNTFKILSIAKKWESFDATDDELDAAELSVSCRTLCLDDAERRNTSPN